MIKIKTIEVSADKLILDPNNPRFARHFDQLIDDSKAENVENTTFEKMLEGFDVKSLADNIHKNGFLGFDRLFVRSYKDKFIVVEGNRRISAIKLLLMNEKKGERGTEISAEIKETFKALPAIDVSNLTDKEIQRMLGLRHFDSVQDWKPLPGSLHLFKAYMEEMLGGYEGDIDDVADKFVLDTTIIEKLSDQYARSKSRVTKDVQIYRLYLQVVQAEPSAANQNNLFSMLTESLKPAPIKRFKIDPQLAVFSESGLTLFIKLIVGEGEDGPIITEVSKGDRAYREYESVLRAGTEQDKERIEDDRIDASVVWADVKKRQEIEGIKQIVSRIEKDLGKLTIEKIDVKELSNSEIDVLKELRKNIDKVLGALL